MDIFVPAIWIGSGVCLFAGVQFGVFGLIRRQERVFLAFGVLALLLGIYMLFSAQWYRAASVESIADIARYEMGIICLVYPVFIWFVSLFTYQESFVKFLIPLSIVFGILFVINIGSPYSFLYSSISLDAPIVLPWGEAVSHFELETSPVAWPYYAATYTVFFWAFYRCAVLWKTRKKRRAIAITVYLAAQILAILHAELIDNLNLQSVYLGEFVFLILVIQVSATMIIELRSRSLALELSNQGLREETARRESYERQLDYMAYHDYLTNLPNRRDLPRQLENVRRICCDTDSFGTMLLVDLDHFKIINDSLGHDLGDRMLQMIAQRLIDMLPADNLPARLGGDEFAVLIGGLATEEDEANKIAIIKARELADEIVKPYRIDEHELVIGVSIGITIFKRDSMTLSEIMKQADMALYRAKSFVGRNSIEVFTPPLKKDADQRLIIDRDMRTAIENGDIELHFQPQVDCAGTVIGTEVLSRWDHPELGHIPPNIFIMMAEESGLIHALGENVLWQACHYFENWKKKNFPVPPHLSINVSPWQLDSFSFNKVVTNILEDTGIEASRLNLEITESTFLRDINSVARKMAALSEMGITFSIDDFGTGYSALAWLKKLSLHELKIDKSFIHEMSLGQSDKLIETIIAIARHLGLRIIAEGVETEAQRDALAAMGCRYCQGYLVSKPLPEPEYIEWLRGRQVVTG